VIRDLGRIFSLNWLLYSLLFCYNCINVCRVYKNNSVVEGRLRTVFPKKVNGDAWSLHLCEELYSSA